MIREVQANAQKVVKLSEKGEEAALKAIAHIIEHTTTISLDKIVLSTERITALADKSSFAYK